MTRLQKKQENRTLFWIVMTSLMSEPLFVMYGFSTMLLRKNLGASELLIGAFLGSKPIVSIFSFYWGAYLMKRPSALRSNFLFAKVLGLCPFLLFPFFMHPYFFVFSCVNYILFYRAAKPAWIEILHINTTKAKKRWAFSWAFTLSYLIGMALAAFFGAFLDSYPNRWPELFVLGTLINFINIYYLAKLPVRFVRKDICKKQIPWKSWFLLPWRHTKDLMKRRKDFAKFQWGFMLCGFGLMFIQPAITLLLVDVLKVSYLSFGLAYTSWKSICIAISSPVWGKLLPKFSVFSLSSAVFLFASLLPFFLLFSPQNILWLYVAYIFYGIAQGGSQLIWNLSGPIFSGEEDSAPYTATNVMMIGMRGLFAPFLGAIVTKYYGPFVTLFLGFLFCIAGSFFILPPKASKSPVLSPQER